MRPFLVKELTLESAAELLKNIYDTTRKLSEFDSKDNGFYKTTTNIYFRMGAIAFFLSQQQSVIDASFLNSLQFTAFFPHIKFSSTNAKKAIALLKNLSIKQSDKHQGNIIKKLGYLLCSLGKFPTSRCDYRKSYQDKSQLNFFDFSFPDPLKKLSVTDKITTAAPITLCVLAPTKQPAVSLPTTNKKAANTLTVQTEILPSVVTLTLPKVPEPAYNDGIPPWKRLIKEEQVCSAAKAPLSSTLPSSEGLMLLAEAATELLHPSAARTARSFMPYYDKAKNAEHSLRSEADPFDNQCVKKSAALPFN